jgi:Ala-tRNA(Pro) deacylase
VSETYTRLVELLDRGGARYRLIEHAPEGRTDIVSAMRGHDPALAAKCMIVMVKIGKRVTRHVLAVVPGDARVDLNAIRTHLSGTYVSFAAPETAERLAGTGVGTILPFTFHADLELVMDPALLQLDEMFFNAARLDRSIGLKVEDYRRIANPRILPIAAARR